MQSILRDGPVEIKSVIPKVRGALLNHTGWGYNDSRFKYSDHSFTFTGKRYDIGNGVAFPNMRPYTEEKYGIKIDDLGQSKKLEQREENYPIRVENLEFLEEVKSAQIEFTHDFDERILRAHGQSASDMFTANFECFPRLPDLILFPKNHDNVEKIVNSANEFNVALIPVGGCTNVAESCACPGGEKRQIAVVDCSQMNRLLWIDRENHLACFESGVVGQDLERTLNLKGFTMGHEPDSIEFSTLGGWVSTRASGMKRQKYGNIEDIVKNFKLVTSIGTFNKKFAAPRVSMGPNFDEVFIGSEGIFGILTEVVIKIHEAPEIKRYGSIIFHDFDSGIDCMREIAKSSCQPASLRLVDNFHFDSRVMLHQSKSKLHDVIENLKTSYLSLIKRYDLKKVAVATFLFEGKKNDVERDESILLGISKKHGGYSSGQSYGKMGYQVTFYIAYIRDLMFDLGILAESYETSVTWSRCKTLLANVISFWNCEMKQRDIKLHQLGYRISQLYNDGVCCYFYFGYRPEEMDAENFSTFKEIRSKFLDVIHSSGGSLSHHHGIGKKLRKRYEKTTTDVELKMLRAIKKEIDPKNIFAVSNLLSDFEGEPKAKL